MRKLLLFFAMLCVSTGVWAVVYEMKDYNPGTVVAKMSVDGSVVTIEFTGNGDASNFDVGVMGNTSADGITEVIVKGTIPDNVNNNFLGFFNNTGYGVLQNCTRMDFSQVDGKFPSQVHNRVNGVILPSGKSFTDVSGGNYIIIANDGDSEENAVQVCVKSGTDWASDPAVDDASYLKVYDSDGTTYLESDEVTALQSTKWVNGTGTVVSVEDLMIHADSEDEVAVLNQFLNVDNKLIKNLTVDGELSDLTMFDGVEVKKNVDFSGITNTDLSTMKLPTTTGTISLPGGSYQNGTVTLNADYTQDQLKNIVAALNNSGISLNTIAFAGGSTFNCDTNELEVSTADEDGGNLNTIAADLRAADYTIESVRLEKYGTSWSDGKMILSSDHSDQEAAQKTLLEDAGFTVNETKVTRYPDVEVTVDDNGVVTIKSYREGALNEMLNANDDEANAAKAIINADSAKGEGSKLVLEGAFKADDLTQLTQLNNATESVDMSNTTFSNAADAKFTYWGQSTLKTAYMSNDSKVTTITDQCFQNMGSIENLYIGESVTEVPASVFASRTSLKHVTIPSSVLTIGNNAFQGCTSLSDIDWGDDCHIETIGDGAFERTNIKGTFTVPNSIKTIGANAFKDNNNIKTLIFGEYSQIESIGAGAFSQAEDVTIGLLSDVYVNVRPAREIECAHGAFDKTHAAAQTQVGTVTTRLHYPRELYEYYVGEYKSGLYDPNLDYVEDGETKHAFGIITQDVINRSFENAANGWQEFMSSGIPVGSGSLYRTYSEEVSHLVPDETRLQIYLVHDYDKNQNVATCVQMKEGDLIPANTGFIIHSSMVATIYLPFAKAQANPYNHEDYPANTYKRGGEGEGYNNYLKPINGTMHIDNVEIVNGKKTYRNYFFNNGKTAESRPGPDWKDDYLVEGWGFFRAVSKDYTVWNKAFLHLPADMTNASSTILSPGETLPQDQQQGDSGAKSFGMYIIGLDDDGVVTPVERVSVTNESCDGYFTLQGVRVNAPADKGIYIHNGKKVIVK